MAGRVENGVGGRKATASAHPAVRDKVSVTHGRQGVASPSRVTEGKAALVGGAGPFGGLVDGRATHKG